MSKRLSNRKFLNTLMKDPEFKLKYASLDHEFSLLEKMLQARLAAGLSQSEVAKKMHTTTSVIGRLETAGGQKNHSPTLNTLERYASAMGYKLNIEFVPVSKAIAS
ncbi:MAG: helix-turn-helix domain-containing protein [Gammaproteobacteria bacterium]